jgi:pilus assembly protein Flp/PilA
MVTFLLRFLSDDDGTTAIEYALLVAGVALAIIATVNTLGNNVLTQKFGAVNAALSQ